MDGLTVAIDFVGGNVNTATDLAYAVMGSVVDAVA